MNFNYTTIDQLQLDIIEHKKINNIVVIFFGIFLGLSAMLLRWYVIQPLQYGFKPFGLDFTDIGLRDNLIYIFGFHIHHLFIGIFMSLISIILYANTSLNKPILLFIFGIGIGVAIDDIIIHWIYPKIPFSFWS